jgi:uncharacterized protein (DUF3084 family)
MLGTLGSAAGRRGGTRATEERLDAAEDKLDRLEERLEDLESELADEVTEIDQRWATIAGQVDVAEIAPKRTNVTVSELCLAWVPVER